MQQSKIINYSVTPSMHELNILTNKSHQKMEKYLKIRGFEEKKIAFL